MSRAEKLTIGLAVVGLFFAACSCVAAWLVVPSAFSLFSSPHAPESARQETTPTPENVISQTENVLIETPVIAERLTPTAELAGTSHPTTHITPWQGEYYPNTEFRPPVKYSREDLEIAFDWGDANPGPDLPIDGFSVRWTKCMVFENRYYLFKANADNRLVVYLDDVFILKIHNIDSVEQKFFASAGLHCIKVEFIDYYGEAYVSLDVVPAEQPTPVSSADSWQAEYYPNTEFRQPIAHSEFVADIAFDWGYANPAPDLPLDHFSVRWTKCSQFEEASYAIRAGADNRLTVYIDDTQVVRIHNTGTVEQEYLLSAGEHCIRIDYIDYDGVAYAFFEIK